MNISEYLGDKITYPDVDVMSVREVLGNVPLLPEFLWDPWEEKNRGTVFVQPLQCTEDELFALGGGRS
jgi:hypothetical protein